MQSPALGQPSCHPALPAGSSFSLVLGAKVNPPLRTLTPSSPQITSQGHERPLRPSTPTLTSPPCFLGKQMGHKPTCREHLSGAMRLTSLPSARPPGPAPPHPAVSPRATGLRPAFRNVTLLRGALLSPGSGRMQSPSPRALVLSRFLSPPCSRGSRHPGGSCQRLPGTCLPRFTLALVCRCLKSGAGEQDLCWKAGLGGEGKPLPSPDARMHPGSQKGRQ